MGWGDEYSCLWSFRVWQHWELQNFVYPESSFNPEGANANFSRLPRQKSQPCLGGAAFPSRERYSEPAQFETELWRKPKHWTMLSQAQQFKNMLFIRFSSYFFITAGACHHQLSWLTVSPTSICLWYAGLQESSILFTYTLAGLSLCTHYYCSCSICPPPEKEALGHQDCLPNYYYNCGCHQKRNVVSTSFPFLRHYIFTALGVFHSNS